MHFKKRSFIIIIVLLLLLPTGCSSSADTDWVPYRSVVGAFGEQGYYYVSYYGCLYFLDVDNGINVCLCSKVGCSHDTTARTDPAAIHDCDAYVPGSFVHEFAMFFWDGGLYYIDSDEYGMHLIRRNADGTGLRQIGTICQPYIEQRKEIVVQSYICAGGYLYYCADICGLIDNNVETESCVLRRMDLKSGKEEELICVPGYEYVSLCAAKGNGVLYQHYLLPERTDAPDDTEKRQASPIRLMLWEEGVPEDTALFEKTFGDGFNYKAMINGALLYTTKEGDGFVTRSFDLDTKTDQKVSDVSVGTFITEKYALRTNPATKKRGIYHIEQDIFLANDFEENTLRFHNSTENKIILERTLASPNDPTAVEKMIYFYVDADDLADGLQQEDAVDFRIFQFS